MPKKMADRTFKKGIAIAICIMMALSGSLILWNGNTEENVDTTPVIVYLRSPSDTQLLKARGVDVVESYGGFVLANLAEREMRFLKHQGFSVEAERELHTVALNGFTIDTRVGTPSLPSDLFIEAYPMGMDGRYIVQFIGPVKDEWTRTVTNLGAEVGNYLPNNAFIVNMNEETKDIVSRLRFVQWVDVFQPAYKIRPELWDKDDSFDVKIITYEGKGANSVLARLTEEQTISAYVGEDFGLVRATVDTSMLPMLANIPGVSYVEPLYEIRAYNSYMQWTVQTNRTDDEKMFDMGLDGTGQLIALADTGVDFDHPAFRHDAATITIGDIYNVTDMTRRKVVRYMPMASYVGLDPWVDDWAFQDSKIMPFAQTMGHGTMMAGIAVANDDYMDISPNDGAAMGAKLIVQDVANVCQRPAGLDDCFSFIPDDYDDFFGPVYDEGARIHTNSWGTPEQTYDLEARMVDEFVFGHTDMFITWSAGNGGPLSGEPHTVGSPANAKGVVSLGWVGSPSPLIPTTQYNVNGQGSTGPTPDNRMKPELVNLGEGTSTISDGNPWSDLYRPDDLIFGTSYGAPATAGMAAIIRQYYEEGYYPTGTAHPASATNVSAAMVKALLMASGERCTEGFRDSVGEQQWPNNSQGWGRPLLDNVLYFPGDPKKTISVDHTAGLITGDVVEYNFTVLSNSEPLRVMLVWSDYPGTLGAATVLVNDLDLEVTDPLGNAYKGNVFSIPFATSQSRTGGGFDHENPTEGVHRWYPTPGVYNVKITGFNVPRGPQPFALVMNADIDTGFGQIMIDRAVYSENDIINIEVMDTNLVDDGINNKAYVTSTTEDVPETVNLTETEVGSGIWTASITTAFGAPYENNTLEVSDKDTITAWYDDPDPIHTATAHAVVDAAGPIITDVFVRDITNAAATVTWVTDEPSDSTVYWGETSALGTVTHDPVLMTYHEVDLLGLSTGVQYFFDVQSADWLGHSTLDDNGGVHYTFSTTEKAEILLVIGDGTFPSGKIPYWRNAIMYGGWSFNEYYVARTGDPDLSVLQRYKVVAWQTGFEQYPAFEDTQIDLLTNYLDGGGRLFVVSHDVAWASHPASGSQFWTPKNYAFLKDSLKSEWLDDPLDWGGIEGVIGDPIGGIYAPPNTLLYEEFRNGGAGDEVTALAAGGTTDYVFKSLGGVSNNDNCAIRWVSSMANGTADPNITWGGYPSKVVAFFFELVQINYFTVDDPERGDIVNKTIIWLLDGSYHPIAEVSHPNGGEVFSGATLDVYWNVTAPVGVANQSLFYSDDSGQTWKPIDLAVGNATNTYAWDISGLPNGDDYMVKIIVEDSSTPPLNGTDTSDSTFSIFRPGGDTVGPVTVPGSVRVTPNPVIETGNVTFDAIVTDELKGDSNIAMAEYFVQDTEPIGLNGTGVMMAPKDGSYDSKLENVTWDTGGTPVKNFGWGTVGPHTVWVHGLDASGNWGPFYNATFHIIPTPPDRRVLPPSGITADLSGVAFADVTLTYTLSGDDGAGENDVVRYDIYRGTTYDAFGTGYINIGNSPAGTNTYVDGNAGNGDGSNYFYYVVAVDDDGNENTGIGQAGKYTRWLTAGVNLVSNPLIVNDYGMMTVLQTVSFDKVWVYDPSVDPNRPWITYDVAKGYYTPGITDNFRGAWVNVLADGYFTLAGVVPTPSMTIQLEMGWNLVGYPSFSNIYTLWDLLNATNADRVETYDPAGAPYNLRHVTDPFEVLTTGSGYWIHVSAPVTWTVMQG